MAVELDSARQERTMRDGFGVTSDVVGTSNELIRHALKFTGLTVQQVPPGVDASLESAGKTIVVRKNLTPTESNFTIAAVLAAQHLFPNEPSWSYAFDSSQNVEQIDSILRVDVSTETQRKNAQITQIASEFLLPANVAADLFNRDQLTASEVAAKFELPISIVFQQLLRSRFPDTTESEAQTNPRDFSLDLLDPSQRAAATADPGPVLVGAGPGTGKTRTLVSRVVHLVRDRNIKPQQILALTYSRAAAAQMQAQIGEALTAIDRPGKPWVGTLHSFGMELVRQYFAELGFEREPELIDTLDGVDLLEPNLELCGLDLLLSLYDPAPNLASILGRISRAKDELCTPDRYRELSLAMLPGSEQTHSDLLANIEFGVKVKKAERDTVDKAVEDAQKCLEIAQCYAVYEQLKQARNLVDYGDLITLPVRLLETHPSIAREIGQRFPQIVADEYQDVNRASARLLKLLSSASDGHGLWVVGDHRQSIYRFRGSSPVNIRKFRDDYPTGRHLELEVNYRSVKPIVNCFSHFAQEANLHDLPGLIESDIPHAWKASRQNDADFADAIELYEADSPESQNDGIARLIEAEIESGRRASDIAILCRTNTQVEQIASALENRRLSTLVIGDPFTRPGVQDILALFAFGTGEIFPALYRIVQMPQFSVCDGLLPHVIDSLGPQKLEIDPEDESEQSSPVIVDRDPLAGMDHPGAERLLQIRDELATYSSKPDEMLLAIVFDLLPRLKRECGIETPAQTPQVLLAIQHLLALAAQFQTRVSRNRAFHVNLSRAFLEHLRRMIGLGLVPRISAPLDSGQDSVKVITVHAAKGLEFPVTIIPYLSKSGFHSRGQNDGLADPAGMVEDEDDSAEDAYLFFVALSRAKDKLVLTRPVSKNGKAEQASPFYEMVAPWLEERGCESKIWDTSSDEFKSDSEPDIPFKPIVTGKTPVFTEYALASYMRCPRAYFYEHIEKLAVDTPKSPYQMLHGVVWQTLGWLRKSWASEELAELSDVLEHLNELWPESGLEGAQNEAVYRARAVRMVTNAFEHGPHGKPLEDTRLEAQIDIAKVRIPSDSAYESDDESVTLVRYKLGRRGDDDHTDKRLALMRRAAESSGKRVQIRLHYLATGHVVDVEPSPRYEPGRIQKYIEAAQGIIDKKFDPKPSLDCRRCLYMLICQRGSD